MFTANIYKEGTENPVLTFKSDNRNYMRNLALLCEENKVKCEVVVEEKPRMVKFKGVG